ncbi:hypothetical protein [Halomonas huangheensis]|uniref:Uncharacterized protein n=1 Tax=Halomonas huangheensis TaxID=1178482 RepID=W1N5K0_9GAMM|nr:hypothetical protein [Halomonas huangheensis]ALM51721.1 hypothetical protein AR456_05025 [Halomonas huangheensis]ERL50215.1 hypothetical protein BJB45_03550 [Halomonas huangheensis]
MKIKLITASLLLAALPLAAQADPATERALQLSEPLSASTSGNDVYQMPTDVLSHVIADGSSTAMAKARLNLYAQQQGATNIEVDGDPLQLAWDAAH